ncbi:MAG: hypothetical protein JWR83_1015 [Aeromicrobium sp.]|nr:hypothetical protein [Aeromicrobium sp.]
MSIRERLASLSIQRWSLGDRWDALHPPTADRTDWGLTFPSEFYCTLFDRTFPALAKNTWRITAKSCATFFRGISEEELAAVSLFVESLRPCVVIKDLTDGSIALGFRARKGATGDLEPTELGQLMRGAKPYGVPPAESHRKAGRELARQLGVVVSAIPLYQEIDGFVAVPSSNPKTNFSLPRGFTAALAKQTGKADLSNALTKANSTKPLKNLAHAEKLDALIGSVSVDGEQVRGKSLVVVDDLYQSGLTINYIAEELRVAGAKSVFGLAAVKTLRDSDNRPRPPSAPADQDDDEELF